MQNTLFLVLELLKMHQNLSFSIKTHTSGINIQNQIMLTALKLYRQTSGFMKMGHMQK